jgi:Protein of unknown function (DUF3445)
MYLSSIALAVVAVVLLLLRKYRIFPSRFTYGSSRTINTEEAPVESEDIIPILDFDISTTPQRPYRPWSSGKFAMTMGVRKLLPDGDPFLLDKEYIPQQELRRHLLVNNRQGVMQQLPGSEEACIETLDFIVDWLTKRYPRLFVLSAEKPGYIHNCITDMRFKITAPYEASPLEVAAQLVMEDINILMQGEGDDPEQHYL